MIYFAALFVKSTINFERGINASSVHEKLSDVEMFLFSSAAAEYRRNSNSNRGSGDEKSRAELKSRGISFAESKGNFIFVKRKKANFRAFSVWIKLQQNFSSHKRFDVDVNSNKLMQIEKLTGPRKKRYTFSHGFNYSRPHYAFTPYVGIKKKWGRVIVYFVVIDIFPIGVIAVHFIFRIFFSV